MTTQLVRNTVKFQLEDGDQKLQILTFEIIFRAQSVTICEQDYDINGTQYPKMPYSEALQYCAAKGSKLWFPRHLNNYRRVSNKTDKIYLDQFIGFL